MVAAGPLRRHAAGVPETARLLARCLGLLCIFAFLPVRVSSQASSNELIRSPVAVAALNGHVQLLERLAKGGTNLYSPKQNAGDHDQGPLHLACHHGHIEVAEYLLSAPARQPAEKREEELSKAEALNMGDARGNTCVHLATLAGNMEVLQLAVDHGADLNIENERSGTALHVAASVGMLESIRKLLRLGADPCARNKNGKTAAEIAEEEEYEDAYKVLWSLERAKCKKKPKDPKQKASKRRKRRKSDL